MIAVYIRVPAVICAGQQSMKKSLFDNALIIYSPSVGCYHHLVRIELAI